MPLYRDEAIVLRTQKLGEADRIVTLLTRQHGKVRAVAKGVRRTTSRFGARLEPFSTSTCSSTRAHPRHRHPGRDPRPVRRRDRSATTPRYTAGDRDARDRRAADARSASRRCSSSCCSSGALRALAARRARDPALVLDAFLLRVAGGRRLGAGASTTARGAARRARTGRSTVAGRRRGLPGLPPARLGRARPRRRSSCSRALLAGDWAVADASDAAAPPRGAAAWSPRYLQWHLERGLRSLRAGGARSMTAVARSGRHDRSCRPSAAPVRAPAAGDARPSCVPRHVAHRHGRQRPLGQRTAGCRAPRATRRARPSLLRRRRGRHRDRREVRVGVRVLDRELEALARRGPLPDGLQPRRDPPPPRRDARAGACGSAGPAGARGCGAA